MIRQYIGTTIFALLGIALGSVAIVNHVWLLVAVGVLAGVAAVLLYPVPAVERSAFGVGDFSGSRFVNVYSDADDFIRGKAHEALFINIIHRSQARSRRHADLYL